MDVLESNLRPILQPITTNLPAPIRDLGESLIGEQCYTSLVRNIALSDTKCLKLGISKALGIGIIGASSIVKIPQLLKLLNSQSAEGISFLSYLLETSSFLISLMYNVRNGFPFSTYGEVALIAVQNVAISILVLQYSGKGPAAAAFVAGLAGAGYAMYNSDITPLSTLQYLQAGAGLLGVASKLPQIITIFQEGGTGQLSAFAVRIRPYRNLDDGADANCRSSITSPDLSPVSSPPCRKWTTNSFCTASSQASCSMLCLRRRCYTIGMLQRASPLRRPSSSPVAKRPPSRPWASTGTARLAPRAAKRVKPLPVREGEVEM